MNKTHRKSKLIVAGCLIGLSAIFAAADLKMAFLNGWPVVMAWFSMLVGWGVLISAVVDRYSND